MRLKLDPISKFIVLCILLFELILPNGFFIFFPSLVLLAVITFLQQPYKASIFTFVAIQHYIQIVAAALLCNYLGKDINYNTPFRGTVIIVSSIGVIALLAPVMFIQNEVPNQTRESLTKSASFFSTNKTMYAYIISFFVAYFLNSIAFLFGGITQIIIWVANVKWAFFLLFGYVSLLKKEKTKIFYLFVLIEFLSGFYSFFADFKTVIYFLLVLLLSLVEKINARLLIYGIFICGGLVVFALMWTNVKDNYRSFLNGGQKKQAVTVNSDEALNKLYDLSNNTDDNLEDAVPKLLDRVQYTYFFAKTMERVPETIPYQNGNNWLENIEFTTTPRYLNPDKPTLDQSEKTSHYTGIRMSGKSKGTSFSLGYFAEFYIDFGIYGMMLGLFLLGILYSLIYNYLLKKSSNNIIFNYCVAAAFFMEFNPFAIDGTYLLGKLISGIVVFWILIRYFFPWVMESLSDVKKTVKR
jgi:hypothetical protein